MFPYSHQTLRARVAAKTEEKKLELLFLRWSEHHKRLSNFIRFALFNCKLMRHGSVSSSIFQSGRIIISDFKSWYTMQVIFNFGPKVSIFTFYSDEDKFLFMCIVVLTQLDDWMFPANSRILGRHVKVLI